MTDLSCGETARTDRRIKLTLEIARRMRVSRQPEERLKDLGARFGVGATTAMNVIKGYSWREPGTPRKFNPRFYLKATHVCEHCQRSFLYRYRKSDPPRHFCSRRCSLLHTNPFRKLPPIEELSNLYNLRGWSLGRIALRYGCCFQAVQRKLIRAGIPRRAAHGIPIPSTDAARIAGIRTREAMGLG